MMIHTFTCSDMCTRRGRRVADDDSYELESSSKYQRTASHVSPKVTPQIGGAVDNVVMWAGRLCQRC